MFLTFWTPVQLRPPPPKLFMYHIPVLKEEIVHIFSYLSDLRSGVFVDGTIGNAGHSISLIQNSSVSARPSLDGKIKSQNDNSKIIILAIDKDQTALKLAEGNAKKEGFTDRFTFIHNDFKNIKKILNELKIDKINGALLDLGVSSMQLDDSSRGFSFKNPEKELDMRMDQTQTFSAKDIVNSYSEFDLLKIIREYGEEKNARKIAEKIVTYRKEKSIKTVGDLLEILKQSIPKKEQFKKIHFATKTFQALRIEVNGELEGLGQAICDFCDSLSPGGKLAIISFHSLEDRIVKQAFNELANPCHCPSDMPCVCNKKPTVKIETKKPITASNEEITLNPRSRSAKLRIVQKA